MAISNLTEIDEITDVIQFAVSLNGQDYRAGAPALESYINYSLANTGVTPGTYGSSTLIPVLVVNSKGQITSASTVALGTGLRLDQLSAPTSAVSFANQKITNLATPTAGSDGAPKSYVDTAISSTRLDQLSAPASPFSMAGYRLLNLGTPTAGTDATTKDYVDALLASGGIDGKASVLCGSTANIAATIDGTNQVLTASANGVLTLDGQFPAVGKRVLMKNQTTSQNNGIYVVTNAGSASNPWILTRSADATTNTLSSSAYVFVETGSTLQGTGWLLTAADPIVLGTTALTWTQFTGGSTYTAGTGLSLVGSQFSVTFGTTAGTALQGAGALGTPSGGTLTNCSGLPISSGVSGLAANIAAFLATPSSANLSSAVTDETGTGGALVFASNPTLAGATFSSTANLKNVVETRTTNATASGALTIDLSLGTLWNWTLTGNVTGITITNPSNCTAFTLRIAQDATGGRTVAWSFSGATVRWPAGIAPIQTSTASKADYYTFISPDGGTSFDAFVGGQSF